MARAAKKADKKAGKKVSKKAPGKAVKKIASTAVKKAAKSAKSATGKLSARKKPGGTKRPVKASRSNSSASKKSASKTSASKKSASKKSAKKSAAKKPSRKVTAGKAENKKAGKTASQSASKKSAGKKRVSRSTAQSALRPDQKTTALSSRLKPVAPAGRKALTASNQRKSARSRLGERNIAHESAGAARKMALRTPVVAPGALRAGTSTPAPRSDTFDIRKLTVRPAEKSDHAAIRQLLDQGFGRPAEGRLVETLRASGAAQGECVAVYEGVLAGHVMLSRLQGRADGRDITVSALAPMAVAPKFTGLGIGTRLVAAALPLARSAGSMAVFVLGKPGFYARFGFSARTAIRFACPWSGASFQVLEFEPAALRCEAGEVNYPPAFAALT